MVLFHKVQPKWRGLRCCWMACFSNCSMYQLATGEGCMRPHIWIICLLVETQSYLYETETSLSVGGHLLCHWLRCIFTLFLTGDTQWLVDRDNSEVCCDILSYKYKKLNQPLYSIPTNNITTYVWFRMVLLYLNNKCNSFGISNFKMVTLMKKSY